MSVKQNTKKKADIARAEAALVAMTAKFPEVTEAGPWGHRAFKVHNKTFLFLVAEGDRLSFSVKLPSSGAKALKLPFAQPTGYGMGKSGWVTAEFASGVSIPLDLIEPWLRESFEAIAPKRLLAAMASRTSGPKKASAKKASAKKVSAKLAAPQRAPAKRAAAKRTSKKAAAAAKSRA